MEEELLQWQPAIGFPCLDADDCAHPHNAAHVPDVEVRFSTCRIPIVAVLHLFHRSAATLTTSCSQLTEKLCLFCFRAFLFARNLVAVAFNGLQLYPIL